MVQTKAVLPPAEILWGTRGTRLRVVAFRDKRSATEGVPYSVTPTAGKLNHAVFCQVLLQNGGNLV